MACIYLRPTPATTAPKNNAQPNSSPVETKNTQKYPGELDLLDNNLNQGYLSCHKAKCEKNSHVLAVSHSG